MKTGQRRIAFGVVGIGLVIAVVQSWRNPTVQSTPSTTATAQHERLTPEHREMITSALRDAFLPQPRSLDIEETGFLVATFDGRQPSMAAAQSFASKALFAMRSAMFNRGVTSNYRVTLNGPPLYGSAEFSEGGSVEWKPHK